VKPVSVAQGIIMNHVAILIIARRNVEIFYSKQNFQPFPISMKIDPTITMKISS